MYFYTRRPAALHKKLLRQKSLHKKLVYIEAIRTKEHLHQKHFTPNYFYNRMRDNASTSSRILHQRTLTLVLHQMILFQTTFTTEYVYTRNPLSPRTFTPEHLQHEGHFAPKNFLHQKALTEGERETKRREREKLIHLFGDMCF